MFFVEDRTNCNLSCTEEFGTSRRSTCVFGFLLCPPGGALVRIFGSVFRGPKKRKVSRSSHSAASLLLQQEFDRRLPTGPKSHVVRKDTMCNMQPALEGHAAEEWQQLATSIFGR
ncbi:unnamed protein product [Ectocarpus sp. 12 AP-2014]